MLALHRALPCVVWSPQLHHTKAHGRLRNFLRGGRVVVSLLLRPNVSALIARIELDRQVGWTFHEPANASAIRADCP